MKHVTFHQLHSNLNMEHYTIIHYNFLFLFHHIIIQYTIKMDNATIIYMVNTIKYNLYNFILLWCNYILSKSMD